MSQISLKSISGITSITTPAGVDNQFTLHTNNTSQALKLDSAGNIHIHNHVNTTGISSASNFKTGSSNLHSTGLSVASIDVGSNIKLGNAGVITATSFSGSGANLTSLPAQATIANNADNRVITGGSGVNLNGEANLTFDGTNLDLSDGKYVRLGASNDFQMWHHSGGNSYIKETGGGALVINADDFYLQNNATTTYLRTHSGGAIDLNFGGNKKFETTNTGAVITGICTATAFKGDIVPATYHGGRRNMFINGEFMIDQRGDRNPMANQNNGANALGYGGPDHVKLVTNLGAFEAKQANETNSPRSQAGATYSYELDCTSASGPSTSNYTFLTFHWSGIETNRLLYGTSNARPVTISFWVQCNKTGNFTVTLRNETPDKLISKVITISSADTWEYKTITFVGDTAAQIAVTSGARWTLELWLDGGSNYTGGTVRTGWTAKNNADRGAGSTLNICSSTSNYFRISLLQVEMGPYATPFEFRTYGEYLHDCEYYFQKPHGINPFAMHVWGHKVADTYALRVQTLMRPTEMRQNPTDYFHDNNPSGSTAQRYTIQGADYEYTYGVGMGIGSNRKEFTNGTKYPYGVTGMGAGESGILWAFDFESYAEF